MDILGIVQNVLVYILYGTGVVAVKSSEVLSYNEYTPEERAKMGRYGAKNGPSKITKHFSLLSDGK